MNRRVKILKIFAAMPNQRPRERRPGFFGHFDGAGNEELVVRDHRQRSTLNAQHSTLKADAYPPRSACGERIEVRGVGKRLFARRVDESK